VVCGAAGGGDPLERLAAGVDFELCRGELDAALDRSDRAQGRRPPYDAVLMFQVLVLQTLYTLSDDQSCEIRTFVRTRIGDKPETLGMVPH
jgi:Transposase domain (DUF772)